LSGLSDAKQKPFFYKTMTQSTGKVKSSLRYLTKYHAMKTYCPTHS